MSGEQPAGSKWAVALVHGIGDSKPIEMLTPITKALEIQRRDLKLEAHVNVHLHEDELLKAAESVVKPGSASPGERAAAESAKKLIQANLEPLRQHDRCGTIGENGPEVRFATAHWSDISMFDEGIIRLIGNLALGGMGVRYFADVGTSGTSPLAKLLHGLLALKIWLLALVLLPLVMCTLVFSLYTFTGYYLLWRNTFYLQAWAIPIASIITIALIVRLARKMLRHMRDERTLAFPIFNVLFALGMALGLIMLIDHPRTLGIGAEGNTAKIASLMRALMEWYGNTSGNMNWMARVSRLDETGVYIGFLQLLQYLCGWLVIWLTAFVLVVLAFAHLPWMATAKQRRGMILASVGVTTIWLLMLLVLWPENLVTATVINLYMAEPKGSSFLPILPIWTFEAQLGWPFITLTLTPIDNLAQLREFMPLIWFDIFYLVFLLCIACVAFFIVRQRRGWSQSHNGDPNSKLDGYRPPHHEGSLWAPRLILAGSYQVAVLIFMVFISIVTIVHTFGIHTKIAAMSPALKWLGETPHELSMGLSNVTIIVTIFMALFLVAAHKIQKAIKLTLDVVNHFANPAKAFPIRLKIRQRFVDTIHFLLKPGGRPHLAVVCHSQGTVISFDTLLGYNKFAYTGWGPFKRRKLVWVPGMWETGLKDKVDSLTILTFGSPIGHLYQHYFATLYPGLSEIEAVQKLYEDRKAGRIRWFNCYRIDDYVGTHIEPLKDDLGEFPVNIPMGVGGHTDYWKDDVFVRLFSEPGMEKVLARG